MNFRDFVATHGDKLVRALDRFFDAAHERAATRVSAFEMRVLLHVAESGRRGLFPVGRSMGVDPRGIGKPIRNLVDAGYITKKKVFRKSRGKVPAVQLLLTEAGDHVLSKYRAALREAASGIADVGQVSRTELDAFVDVAARIIERFDILNGTSQKTVVDGIADGLENVLDE